MKKNLLLLLLSVILFSCEKTITGEGPADIAQDYQVNNFTKIKAKGMFKLMLLNSDSSYVSVQTHKNLIDNVEISTTGNTLNIDEKKEVEGFESYEIYVYYSKPLTEIEIDGKILAQLGGTLIGNKLDIKTQSGAGIDQFNIAVKELTIKAQDKSTIHIEGESTKLKLDTKNLASADLQQLATNVTEVDLKDESQAKVKVENELKGRILNNASLEYTGNPKKDVDIKDRGKIQNN